VGDNPPKREKINLALTAAHRSKNDTAYNSNANALYGDVRLIVVNRLPDNKVVVKIHGIKCMLIREIVYTYEHINRE